VSSHAPSIPTAEQIQKLPPFSGAKGAMVAAGGIGAVLLLATLAGGITTNPKEAYYSYVVAFAYWAGLAFASTILLQSFHATRARWVTVLRRPIEVMAATMPLFLLLFIPIAFGMKEIYEWVDPPATLGREALENLKSIVTMLES
jgi:hypothetical protein